MKNEKPRPTHTKHNTKRRKEKKKREIPTRPRTVIPKRPPSLRFRTQLGPLGLPNGSTFSGPFCPQRDRFVCQSITSPLRAGQVFRTCDEFSEGRAGPSHRVSAFSRLTYIRLVGRPASFLSDRSLRLQTVGQVLRPRVCCFGKASTRNHGAIFYHRSAFKDRPWTAGSFPSAHKAL